MTSYYPEDAIRRAIEFRDRNNDRTSLSQEEAFRNYTQCSRSPASWRFLHFVTLNTTPARFTLAEIPNWESTGSLLEDFDGPWEFSMLDVDIVDAAGKLYETRLLIGDPWTDSGIMEWGIIFDRTNTSRVLAHIERIDDTNNQICQTDEAKGFVDHQDLAKLIPLFSKDAFPGFFYAFPSSIFQTQFELILSFAMHSNDPRRTDKVQLKDSLPLQCLMLKLLGKTDGVNSSNVAASVLCETGPLQKLIAKHTAEPYAICATDDLSLDWYLFEIRDLFRAIRLHDNGDVSGAARVIAEWEQRGGSELFEGVPRPSPVNDFYNGSEDDLVKPFLDPISGEVDHTLVGAYLENFVKVVTIGFDGDDAFFARLDERIKRRWE